MDVQLTVNAPVNYRATMSALRLDRVWLLNAEDNAARTVRIRLPGDLVVLAMLPGLQRSVLAGGVEFNPTQLNQHRPGRDYHQTTLGPTLTSALLIAPDQLRAVAGLFGVTAPGLDGNHLIEPRPHALHRLMRLHIGAMRLVQDTNGILASPEAMRGLENALLEGLAGCLHDASIHPMSTAQRSHEAILRSFDDLLAANPGKSLFMSDICAGIGISARALRACCEAHLGMGPKHFLMLRRMHLARRKLLDGTPDNTSVTDVATSFGFWELGRFAVAYRHIFGELPSATLRRRPDVAAPRRPERWQTESAWFGTQWEAAVSWFHAAEGGANGAVFDPA